MNNNENLDYSSISKINSPEREEITQHSHHLQVSSENQSPVNDLSRRLQQVDHSDFDIGHFYNVDVAGSTYALQIALKNMKERYQRVQKKLTVLEDENSRLIGSRSDLFGEIGKMQDNGIKLREKNLKLNQEVHSKQHECCSVKDQLTAFSLENMKLTSKLLQTSNEKKKLVKQIEHLDQENSDLREGLDQLLSRCRSLPGVNLEIERIQAMTARYKLQDRERRLLPKTDLQHCSKEVEISGYDEIEDAAVSIPESTLWLDSTKDIDTLSIEAFDRTKKKMRKMISVLLKQKEDLLDLVPHLEQTFKSQNESVEERLDTNYNSRFATYQSTINPATITLAEDEILLSPPLNDSGGETNVLVEEKIVSGRQSPFDWRRIEVSDDDNMDHTTMVGGRPQMRNVSTSPDMTLTFDLTRRRSRSPTLEDGERKCPMCNAVFPFILPQDAFESHVVSHFEIENGFEVIT